MRTWLFLGLCFLPLAAPAQDWQQGIKDAVKAHRHGDLKKAEEILLKTLFQAEQFGEDDPRLAYTLDYLGTINMQEQEPEKAEPMFLRSLKIFEKNEGPSGPEVLDSLGKLAESYDQRQLWPKSEPLYKRLVDSGRGDAGQQSIDLNNLGIAIDAQGRQDEALALYGKALSLREAAAGPDSPDLAEILNNQARVRYMKGDFGAAEKLYLRSIALDEAAKSPLLADDYRRLAPVYRKQGREADAKDLEAKAAVIEAKNAAKAAKKGKPS